MRHEFQRRGLVAAAAGTFILAACGGGGGGGDTPPSPAPGSTVLAITSSNYQSVAQQSLASGEYLLGSAGLVTGADAGSAGSPLALALQQANTMPRWFKAGAPLVLGASTNQTSNCSGGGRVDAVVSDVNGNGRIDAGDSMAMTAVACKEDGMTMDGKLDITVTSASGDFGSSSFSASMDLKLSGFTVSTGTSKVTGDGLVRVSLTSQGENKLSMTMDVPSFSSSGRVGSTDFQQKLENFALTLQTTPQGLDFQTSTAVRGAITSSSLESKQINVETPVALLQPAGRSYPTSGQVLVRGASGSQLRMTVQSDGRVLLELDADGNGQFELNSFKAWSELH